MLFQKVSKLFKHSSKMSPTIFITGVSGYIGGHTVTVLAKKHPEYKLVLLVRDENQAKIVKSAFPAAETVIGTLDDQEILAEQGKRADVVLRKSYRNLTKPQTSEKLTQQ